MKRTLRKLVWILVLMVTMKSMSLAVSAEEKPADTNQQVAAEEVLAEEDGQDAETDESPEMQEEETSPSSAEDGSVQKKGAAEREGLRSGVTVTGSFDKVEGMDIATIRYYTDTEKTKYAFAQFSDTEDGYEYTFSAPYDGFEAVQGTTKEEGNVVAEYYDLTTWDGAVDVSWYNETSSSFDISTPAQLAGFAAVVNGSINNTTPIYKVKGARSDSSVRNNLTGPFNYDTPQTNKHQKMNEGLPDCIENKYYEKTELIAGVQDEAYEGLVKNDFSNRTVNITSDLDMGGTDPSNIDHASNESSNAYEGTYPNWTPIGGEYLMDPSDGSTMIKASFNGSVNGCGHSISNLYCYRWSYRSVGDTAYGYAQGTGLIGMMGSLYEGESEPEIMSSIKNMSLDGYIYGRRMVGGFVGCMGGGANAASGTSVAGGISMENLANHAEVHCTDSKGLGGIVACSMVERGSIINCYNTGYMDANYAAPTGGIIGSNEGMSVYCCYNTGTLNTHGNQRGRGIGCNNGGKNYRVDDCYYLENCGDDPQYPGYYTYNLAKSVSVNTESMTDQEMRNGVLLQKLNVNGTAYVAGDDGYPVLYWEKNASPGTGSLTIEQNQQGGTVEATQTGSMENGSVVYLSNTPATGWKCRYYLLGDNRLSGNYVTVNGSCSVSGYFESAHPGIIKIDPCDVCTVSVTKNGIIYSGDTPEDVTDYPVKNGDPVYEGDFLMVTTQLRNGAVPENEDLIYKASAPGFFSNPYQYTYKYTDEDDQEVESHITESDTYTVGIAINGQGVSLELNVLPLTTQKMWKYSADTSWYNDSKKDFTLSTARQLAGFSVLVDNGKTFAGKTVKLGKDISLINDDGTDGKRFWDGIGSVQANNAGFAGVFDGAGHKIIDYNGNANGLFEYCEGVSESNKAVIKNLQLWGKSEGQNACGFVMKAKNTLIENCVSYCTVKGTTSNGHTASILGYANGNCEIKNCVNYAQVEGYGYVGGIAAEMNVTSILTGCVNRGNVFSLSTGGNNVGGLVGSLNGQIYGSANYGNIRAYGRNIGGIAGQSVSAKAAVESCGNYGKIIYQAGESSYDSVGGIIGFASIFAVKNTVNYGEIEKPSGAAPTSNIGGAFGREGRNSKSRSEDVYYLDVSCEYAEAGMREEDLDREADYCRGIHSATAAEFALPGSVLAAVNDQSVFEIINGEYPELKSSSGQHIHSGGEATCSRLAVCDDCGLSYGLYSDAHGGTRLVGAKPVTWMEDGYTGDICCKECGRVITKGSVVEADPNRPAVSVIVREEDNSVRTSTYSVGSFDSLKTQDTPIGYSYGSKSEEIVATSQYVTLTALFNDLDITANDVSSIVVECTGVTNTIDKETLDSCNKYFEDGQEYAAPAAFMIAWNTDVGTLEQVVAEAKPAGTIRFGYGISRQQYEENASVGGARLISPVETVTINIGEVTDAVSIKDATITVSDMSYTGSEVKPSPVVKLNGETLEEGEDYSLLYSNNVNAGKAKVIVVGKGEYTGSRSEFFRIRGLSVEDAEFDLPDAVYTGSAITPSPDITLNDKELTEGSEYTISYADNINVGTASVTITGIGNYESSLTKTFEIKARSLKNAHISAEDMEYTGRALTPRAIVSLGGQLLKSGTDYTAEYSDNTNAGTAKILITGKGNYSDTAAGSFAVNRKSIVKAVVSTLSDQVYSGAAMTPNPAVSLEGKRLSAGKDYTISCSNNRNVGTATATITGKGNYQDSVKKTFRIRPQKAAVSKLTVKKGRKLVVKIKIPVSKTGGTKYCVQYTVKGKNKWKTVNTKKQSVTLKKLKPKKKYQIRVRAVNGSFTGDWSTVKTTKKIKK